MSAAAASLGRELAALRVAKLLKVASVVQDLADSTLALNDVRGELYCFVAPFRVHGWAVLAAGRCCEDGVCAGSGGR